MEQMFQQMFNINASFYAMLSSEPTPAFMKVALSFHLASSTQHFILSFHSSFVTRYALLLLCSNLPYLLQYAAKHLFQRNNLPCLLHKISSPVQYKVGAEGKSRIVIARSFEKMGFYGNAYGFRRYFRSIATVPYTSAAASRTSRRTCAFPHPFRRIIFSTQRLLFGTQHQSFGNSGGSTTEYKMAVETGESAAVLRHCRQSCHIFVLGTQRC
jgi:hypothetical protein